MTAAANLPNCAGFGWGTAGVSQVELLNQKGRASD